ncbi:MAG: hypothetical protein ABJO97_24855 [Roseibium sp.]|uniref:hypothetical protein n=1 Tax=Roseibium sp. TaxID=1936156 RepID=UPI0032635F4E
MSRIPGHEIGARPMGTDLDIFPKISAQASDFVRPSPFWFQAALSPLQSCSVRNRQTIDLGQINVIDLITLAIRF